MTDHSQYRLGKHSAAANARVPYLFKHMMAVQPQPAVDWAKAVKSFPMLANDRIGCCTSAAALHLAQVWLAGTTGGRVLEYWKDTGIQTSIGTETILHAAINLQNPGEVNWRLRILAESISALIFPFPPRSSPRGICLEGTGKLGSEGGHAVCVPSTTRQHTRV
jgi:hypothetical protein